MIPPKRVLAAVDFSDASGVALGFAGRLARQCGAELHVVHAEHPLLAAAARSQHVDLVADARHELATFASSVSPARLGASQLHVVSGDAVNVILDVAHREVADVIVVAARGISRAERLVFGSTTEGVLRGSPISVLVVPDEWTPPTADAEDLSGTGPIIAGVDMTCPSIDAAGAAARLAGILKTDTVLLHVVPRLQVPERWRVHADIAMKQEVEKATPELQRLASIVRSFGPVTLRIETGDVAHCLAYAAAANSHAMLVLGRAMKAHGYGPPGAVAYRVLTLAKVPVLMHMPTPQD